MFYRWVWINMIRFFIGFSLSRKNSNGILNIRNSWKSKLPIHPIWSVGIRSSIWDIDDKLLTQISNLSINILKQTVFYLKYFYSQNEVFKNSTIIRFQICVWVRYRARLWSEIGTLWGEECSHADWLYW